MKSRSASRVLGIGSLTCTLVFALHTQIPLARAGGCDEGIDPAQFQDNGWNKKDKKPKPPHQLKKAECEGCQTFVKDLQKALDDCYAKQLEDIGKIDYSDTSDANVEKQKQQNAAKDGLSVKDTKPPKGKTQKDLKDEVKKKWEALKGQLGSCTNAKTGVAPKPEGGTSPTGGGEQPPTGGGGESHAGSPPGEEVLPTLPKCWKKGAKDKFYQDLKDAEEELEADDKALEKFDPNKKSPAAAKVAAKMKEAKALREAAKKIEDCPEPEAPKSMLPGVPGDGHGMAPKQPEKTPTENVGLPGGAGETCAFLVSTGKIKIDSEGTGETIGHIADLKIQNLTDQPIMCVIQPMVLESGSGKNQHYVCPKGETVRIDPHGNVSVAMNGVCVVRNKPPVGKGVTGDLLINEGNPTIPQNPNSHVSTKQANDMLRICTSKYEAAEKLQKDGALKDLPYHDKQKQLDIVVQWSTWCDPRISELTGAPPATKEDLKKVVYKQVEEKGPMTAETKKKLDQGIDTIFEKIELTTEKAKDLEPEETPAGGSTIEEGAPVGQPEYVGQTRAKNPTPTPRPKPKPGGGKPPQKPPQPPKQEPPKGGGKTEEKPPPPTKPDTPTPAPPAAPDYPTKDQVATFEKKQQEEIDKATKEKGEAGTNADKQKRAQAKLNALDKICHEVKWAGGHTADRKPQAATGYDDANAVLGRLDGIPDARDRLKKAGLTDTAINDALAELNGSADPETGTEQGVPGDSKYRNLAGQLAEKSGLGKRESTTKEEGRTGLLVIDAKLLDQLAKDLKDLYMAEGRYNKDAK